MSPPYRRSLAICDLASAPGKRRRNQLVVNTFASVSLIPRFPFPLRFPPIERTIGSLLFQKNPERRETMANLKKAHNELFRRAPDETFPSLTALLDYCKEQRENSVDRWHAPEAISIHGNGDLAVDLASDGKFTFNDWSFTQLCRLSGVSRETVNRLRVDTVCQVFRETMPTGRKPLQILTEENRIRSIHGTQYARLWNDDLVKMAMETDFTQPHEATGGGTGLYAGEQDLFLFVIDPTGWTEIGDHVFAPGCFLWNSEVGRRSLGIQTFWYQSVCQNHIVWDAVDVVHWSRKHTGDVSESLCTIRSILGNLIAKRDERKDGFVNAVRKAMRTRLGADAEECLKILTRKGITRSLGKKAIEYAKEHGGFSIWCIVDALTHLTQESDYVGLRTEADQKASALLQLAL